MPDDGTISLQDVLSASLKALERSHAGRKIRIVRQIDPTTPRLKAGERRVKEILGTILAEAAAGTEEGGRIRVCLKHSAAAVMVSIKDQGHGMEPGEWDRRAADAERPRAPGAPLTLEECRKVLAAEGGNLFANSRVGKGTTYYLTFPAPRR